jgi:hypothetical protein
MASKRRRITPRYKKKRSMKKRKLTLGKRIQSVVNRNLETKQSVNSQTDGAEIPHNFLGDLLNGELLATTQGVFDPMALDTTNRIGDEINIQSLTIKGMLELNERYSDVTCLIIIVKCPRGDIPTYNTLWQGQSNNKLLDEFNTERYTILARRFVRLKAPNAAAYSTGVIPPGTATGSGIAFGTGSVSLSRATKMFRIKIPGKRFGRNGKIQYVNQTSTPKFYDYRAFVYGYSNFSTASTFPEVFNVARINECIKILKFKDG